MNKPCHQTGGETTGYYSKLIDLAIQCSSYPVLGTLRQNLRIGNTAAISDYKSKEVSVQ